MAFILKELEKFMKGSVFLMVTRGTVWELMLYFIPHFAVAKNKLRHAPPDLFLLRPSSLLGESPEFSGSEF
jgi:hypothetical protein